MSLTIGQAAAASFAAILGEARKPTNQWASSAVMAEFERQGFIVKKDFGPTLEAPLDYRRNPGASFLAYDTQQVSVAKTEILTAASFAPASLSVPVVWTRDEEVQNPTVNQKVALAASKTKNGLDSHDDLVEQALFATSTNGFLGFATHMPTSGQGSDGGIDSALEAWWRLYSGQYTDDTDIEAAATLAWNAATKGSGDINTPTLACSDSATQALYESNLQGMQRWEGGADMGKAGFRKLAFKTALWIYSQYGGTKVYFMGPKALQLEVAKGYFRYRGDTYEMPDTNAFGFKIYSSLQQCVLNRSRLAVIYPR